MTTLDTAPRPIRYRVPKEPRQRAAWLLYQLNRRGLSYAEVARQAGLHRTAPRVVLRQPYPTMERRLAELLGTRPEWIWPERYDAAGQPLDRRWRGGPKGKAVFSMQKSTRRAKARHVEASGAIEQAAAS